MGKMIVGVVTAVVGVTGALLLLAGQSNWWPAWGFVALVTSTSTVSTLLLKSHDPDLIEGRARFGEGTAEFERLVLPAFGLSILGILVIAPLDAARFGWTALPWCSFLIGAAFWISGNLVMFWAMWSNTFFEKTVRIQTERNHRVVQTGPYAVIRHPGYLGTILGYLVGFPLLLNSAWAFVPAVLGALVLVVRTRLEDEFLNDHLEGYAEYASKVRYRLIPGVW